jgi:hypothetical protein
MTPALTGTYTGHCAVLSLADVDVRAMLMPECDLAPQTLTPPGQHPIILLFGDQTGVGAPWLPMMPRIEYLETTMAVPWVVDPNRPRDVMAHTSRLWLNNLFATIGGRIVGFPKIWARVNESGLDYSVRTLLFGSPVFNVVTTAAGEERPPYEFPNYAAIAPIFEQKFLQRFMCMAPVVDMVMQWDMATARMQSQQMTVTVAGGADPGLPPGTYRFKGIDEDVFGAFRLQVNWQLGWPQRVR